MKNFFRFVCREQKEIKKAGHETDCQNGTQML